LGRLAGGFGRNLVLFFDFSKTTALIAPDLFDMDRGQSGAHIQAAARACTIKTEATLFFPRKVSDKKFVIAG
jgi:hypothetical protein